MNVKTHWQNTDTPTDRLEQYLRQIPATGELLYLMPYTLD